MSLQAPLVLSSGAIARYPLSTKEIYATRTNKFSDFSRQTFAQLANPLSQWVLNLSMLQDSEASDWKDLFEAAQGAYAPFSFIDPWDNLLQYSEALETSPWAIAGGSVASSSAVPNPVTGLSDGRVRLITVSNSGTFSLGQSVAILPSGAGNSRTAGITLTASVWLRSASGVSTVHLVLEDSPATEIVFKTVTLTTSWQRISVTHQFSISNTGTGISFVLNTPNATGTFYGFGAQLEADGTASGYKTTGPYSGFHPICYFQTDEMDRQATQFNQNTLQLVIEESN